MPSLEWTGHSLRLLDQTKLPRETVYIECTDYRRVAEAIRDLQVRGAPAIGAAAAFGLVLGAKKILQQENFLSEIRRIAEVLRLTRPTAVNLFWAIDRMFSVISRYGAGSSREEIVAALEQEACRIAEEDKTVNQKISGHGAALFDHKVSVLTHCNAGALATVSFGTALGVIRQMWGQGKLIRVFADETRPLLQGARLTAWELLQEQIPVTLITDSMAGWVMHNHMVDAVIVGADRVALNGDTANKIGTFSVAVLAKYHHIPFYIAAPSSTFDYSLPDGTQIPIEERKAEEVTQIAGRRIAPEQVNVFNPAFDVTPHELIAGIITEYGVLTAPYQVAIESMMKHKKGGQ